MKRYILFICLLIGCRIVSGQSIEYLIGEGDTISSYLPISSNALSIQIYTAEELGFSAGKITKIAFYNTGPDIIVDELMFFMANTDKEFFPEDYDFLEDEDLIQFMEFDNVRYFGSHTFTNGWSEIVFNNGNGVDSGFFLYEGGNIIMLMGDSSNSSQTLTPSFKANTTQENRAVYIYMDENDNQAIAPLKQNNQIKFTVKHIEVSPEEVALGEIRMGDYWTEKEQISVPVTVNSGVDISNISCDNDLFILSEIDYESNPITFNVGYDKNAVADGEQTANITITSAGYEPVVIPVTATAYTPVQGDVFENPIAIDFSDNASFSDTPDFAAFRDDYILPNENKTSDGKIPDVVYSFTLEEESVITTNITGLNSNFAIYKAEDLEDSGPSNDNGFIYSEHLNFFYDFEDASLNDFNLVEKDANNNHWRIIGYYTDNKYIYSNTYSNTTERNFIITKDKYSIGNNSELSFDMERGSYYHDNNVHVYVSPYSNGVDTYYLGTISSGSNWNNKTINLGEKFTESGLAFGNYYISLNHTADDGYVAVDNLKLTEYITDIEEIPLPAGSYYLIASAEDSLSLDVNLKYDPIVDVNVVAIDGASVEGTTVSLVNVNNSDLIYETTLDESGYYQWINVAKGTYELTIDLDGYRSCATAEMLEINADTTINCGLTVITELEFELPEMGSDISYHFWFDEDYDNVQTGSLGDGVFMLDVSELSDGIHTLNVMLEGNMLSSPQSYMFMKMTEIGGGLPEMGTDISYHFWFDEDYDNVQTGSLGDGVFMLDVSELSDGIHTLNVMLEGNMLSSPQSYMFMKMTDIGGGLPEMGSDISYHFWFDEDYDNVQTGSLGDGVFMLDVSELSDGIHTLNVMLEGNMLSSPQSYMFMKMTDIGSGLPEMGSDISYHFWFDEDYDNVQTGSLGDGVFMLDVSELSDGIHTLNVMLEGNMYSSPLTFTFAKSPSYNLNAYCQGGLGEVTGTGVYPDSSYVEIEAVPYEGYHFVCWNDSLVDNPRTIQLTQDTTFIANLMINQYNVELFVQDSTMGSVTGSGIYNYNENIRVQAFSNENHTFLYWMEADSIVSTESEYNFTVKNDRQLTAVFCFGVFHNAMLSEGWNWYSTFVDVEGNAGYEMLTDGLGSNAIIVKSQTHFTTYYEDYDIWDGSLDAVDNEHLYMIKMSDEQNLPMIGAVSDPSNINLTLNPGWTWISYPIKESQALNESLSGFTPRHGDYFKSQTEYARYYEGYGWDGSLLLLESGKGYMYKNSDTIAKTLTYQESDGKDIIVKNITTNDNHWHADINKYADNMNITAVVSFNDVELTADNFEIGAFVDGECRGSAKAVYREMVDRYVFYLTVYGVEDENVSFRLFDSYLDAEYPETEENIVFNVNATIGDIINPYIINYSIDNINELDFEEVVNIYPNPALVNEVVCLNRKYEKVELINSLGIVVNTYINANKIDGIKVPGIYIIRISDGKIITNNKLIVR